MKLILITLILMNYLYADIQLIKKENTDSNTTLLVIAGIHGDEPGGYFASSILSTHYNITSKNLWIVPNLNKDSIQEDKRGINGDMNRKFSTIEKHDKDEKIVTEIKKIILSQNVSLVLNLHDGHGFYRKKDQGNIFNPNAWGQTCVIDQCKLDKNQPFGNLDTIASSVKDNLNKKLLLEHHSFDVKNTNTKFDDETMQLSLTYYAVTNNKPAFAIESSKNLSSLSQKVFYQLLAIEEFMKIMDISFSRNFELNEVEIDKILHENGTLNINNNILLNFNDIKKSLSYIPIKSSGNRFDFSHPLGSVKRVNGDYIVYLGNKKITTLKPQYFKIAKKCFENFDVKIDGKVVSVPQASDIFVNDDFRIMDGKGFRVNVIGFKSSKFTNEVGVDINLMSLDKDFSVDENNKVYRIEFYKDDEFCSMSMVHFK
ncbi:succinylglutamate desuccinylase/aspartoacylase family protein [bacterium]|nr:succinylglutamate desuccinylase/aspartoacylase family protein [bacterium]MBU1994623.1 succinylglutamate desuccinylase/aspartoacylase family protein [bacterium]